MKEPRHSAEAYRLICIILVVVIAVIVWQWNKSENYRLSLLDELNQTKEKVEQLESELYELRGY